LQPPARRVEVDGGEAAHDHPLGQRLAARRELLLDAHEVGAPDDGLELADDLVARALLHQLEEEVAVAALAQPVGLPGDPDAGEGLAQEGADLLAELRDGEGEKSPVQGRISRTP
jgi:hypothetical protein